MNNNITVPEWVKKGNGFPQVYAFLEEDLKRLGINYLQVEDKCIIFDPNQTFELDNSGLFKKEWGSYETLRAAEVYAINQGVHEKVVVPYRRKKFDEYFSCTTKDGISCYWVENTVSIQSSEMDPKYMLFGINFFSDYFHGLVILKSAVKTKKSITLKVPAFTIGRAIGRNGCKAKELAEQLGVKYVKFEIANDD